MVRMMFTTKLEASKLGKFLPKMKEKEKVVDFSIAFRVQMDFSKINMGSRLWMEALCSVLSLIKLIHENWWEIVKKSNIDQVFQWKATSQSFTA